MSGLRLADRLLDWFDRHGRHDLPWRHPATPYRVWLSEIMLQQTQVRTVLPYFARFVERFPDVASLAAADEREVLSLWGGLGYYARARHLHQTAQRVMRQHQGQLPADFDALLALPGIGRSTAGAILAMAWHQPCPILDGNVRRVLCRVYGLDADNSSPSHLWALAGEQVCRQRPADYTQALMDLGATLCRPRQPACLSCPFADVCVAHRSGRTHELPHRLTPPRRSVEHWQWLLLCSRHGMLLERRPDSGRWGGLWSLPELATDHDVPAEIAARYGLHSRLLQALPSIRHLLTHRELHLHPVLLTCHDAGEVLQPGCVWYNPQQAPTLGLPAPLVRLFHDLSRGEQRWPEW